MLVLAFSASAQQSRVSVQSITADNATLLNKQGPDAIGGIGDWHLSNGVLCAVISAVEHEHEFSAKGGALVDLGFCDRADDHFSFTQDLVDGDRMLPLNGQTIKTEISDSEASVVVTLIADGVEMQTRYSLGNEYLQQLRIKKRLRVTDIKKANLNFLSLGIFNYHSLESFVLSSKNPASSPGFSNVDFVTRGSDAIREAAQAADTIITLSPPEAQNPIAYGWQLQSAVRIDAGKQTLLPSFVLADEEAIAFMVLVDDFWIGDGEQIGWLQLPQIPLLGLNSDSVLEFEETIFVGDQASVASVTNQLFTQAAIIQGRAPAHSAVHLLSSAGAGISHQRVGSDGHFSFRAPPGDYVLKHRASANRSVESELQHGTRTTDIGLLALPQIARLKLPRGSAMRLVFNGINGTKSPDFADRLTDYSVAGDDSVFRTDRLAQVFLAGVDSDLESVELAPGDYEVLATRGLEYSVEKSKFSLEAGDSKTLQINEPNREVTTPGFIAADLHVHAGDSFDNTSSNSERVRTFVAEHGEIMVNTEHDVVVDFAPLVKAMGVDNKIASLTGIEMTSLLPTEEMPYTGGHVNFFPFSPKPLEYRNGMIPHEGRRLREVLHDVRQRHSNSVSQLNHPRRNLSLSDGAPDNYRKLIDDGSYLDHMGVAAYPYNPQQPLSSPPNNTLIETHPQTGIRDLDFDAIEVINPGGRDHNERIQAVRRDWMSFLLQGEHITGTANSDSHHGSQQVAVPRNMVAVSQDHVTQFSQAEFFESIKKGNVYGTSGPMLEISLNGKQMGETMTGPNGELELSLSAASWIPLETAEVQVNGHTIQTLDLKDQLSWKIALEFTQDAFVTVEVHGPVNETYAKLYPENKPYAFSNPIYVDANGDGNWQLRVCLFSIDLHPKRDRMPEHEKIDYLEFPAKNLKATKAFFKQVFGWQFTDYGSDYTAFSNQGVDGGFHRSTLCSRSDSGATLKMQEQASK